jgi:hypothetical protein
MNGPAYFIGKHLDPLKGRNSAKLSRSENRKISVDSDRRFWELRA